MTGVASGLVPGPKGRRLDSDSELAAGRMDPWAALDRFRTNCDFGDFGVVGPADFARHPMDCRRGDCSTPWRTAEHTVTVPDGEWKRLDEKDFWFYVYGGYVPRIQDQRAG